MRKQTLIYLTALLFCGIGVKAQAPRQAPPQDPGIHFFQGSWKDAMAEAKKEKKAIFVDAYTSWCGPCRRMEHEVFPQKMVGDFYNQNFLAIQIDMEKNDGPVFAQEYNVNLYPTFLYFDKNGKLMHKAVGGRSPKDFVKVGQEALDSNRSLYGMMTQFQHGKHDAAFMQQLMEKTDQVDTQANNEVRKAYWASQPLTALMDPGNWEIFKRYETDITSPQYHYVLNHMKDFSAKFGTDVVEKTVYAKAAQRLQVAADNKDKDLFDTAMNVLKKSNNEDVIRYGAFSELMFYKQMGQWDKFSSKADEYVTKYPKDDVGLNQLAWAVYISHTHDSELLNKALNWSKQSVDLDKGYQSMDTYASLLYANHKYAEAESAAQDAIELGKQEGQDYHTTVELLSSIRTALGK